MMQITHLDDSRIQFNWQGASRYTANTLRRLIISELPVFAFTRIDILEKSASLPYDELLQTQVELVPLYTDFITNFLACEAFPYGNECAACTERNKQEQANGIKLTPRGCPKCSFEFEIQVCCPEEQTEGRWVTSEDVRQCLSSPPFTIRPVNRPVCHIAHLEPGDVFHIRAYATKGRGKDHARFIPTTVVVPQDRFRVRIKRDLNKILTNEQKLAFYNCCPKKVFDIENTIATDTDTPTARVFVRNSDACDYCQHCISFFDTEVERCNQEVIQIIPEPEGPNKTIHFIIEGTGQHRPENLVRLAFETYKIRLRQIQQTLWRALY